MARPSRAKRKMLREKHREVSATRPAPRRHFDANGRAAMIDAWRQIVGAPSAPELAEANKLQDDAIRTRIAARGYGAAGYDLLAAAPELACALTARPLLVLEFPLLDVLASVQASALDFPHADTEISYHHAPLDAVMAAPEALREQLAQHCGVRLPAATPV